MTDLSGNVRGPLTGIPPLAKKDVMRKHLKYKKKFSAVVNASPTAPPAEKVEVPPRIWKRGKNPLFDSDTLI